MKQLKQNKTQMNSSLIKTFFDGIANFIFNIYNIVIIIVISIILLYLSTAIDSSIKNDSKSFASNIAKIKTYTSSILNEKNESKTILSKDMPMFLKRNNLLESQIVRGDELMNPWGNSIELSVADQKFTVITKIPQKYCETSSLQFGKNADTIIINGKTVKKENAIGSNIELTKSACTLENNAFTVIYDLK